MSLRLRLLLLVVGFVAAGLLITDVVTYNSLKSFLTTRVDQQLTAAAYPVGRALLSSSGLGPEVPAAPDSTGPTSGSASTATGSSSAASAASAASQRLFGPTKKNGHNILVPPGTYGYLRSSAGTKGASLFFSYGGTAPTAPTIPADLPGSGRPAGSDYYFSTSSVGPGGTEYRAVAKTLADGSGVVVVAIPLSELEGTLRQLLWIEVLISALVLIGLGLLSWVMVRRDLRPLEEITETAGAIARGDLSQRVTPGADGTEVGQLSVAFNTMIEEIEVAFAERTASEDRLRRFLADASHELRTPLTSIRGYAELFDLGIRNRPDDLASSMRHIKDEASRMSALVDDLLLLARVDHQRPMRFETVDLVDVAERSCEGIRVSSPDRVVSVVGDPSVPAELDEDRIRQVIDNLLVNAVAHTRPGGRIEVGVSADPNEVELTVQDDGTGIDPEDADRIFEPFFRSDPSRARSSGGAGLGLAIVSAIVDAHGGSIGVGPGPGARFEIRLPRHREVGEPSALDQSSAEATTTVGREPDGAATGGAAVAATSGAGWTGPVDDAVGEQTEARETVVGS